MNSNCRPPFLPLPALPRFCLYSRFLLALFLLLVASVAPAQITKPIRVPLRFCYGLERSGHLQAMEEYGLNTLYIDLLPTDMGKLQPCRDLIHWAQKSGYAVIIGLPTCLTDHYTVSPWNDEYVGTVRELITYFVTNLKDEAGITGWATGHFLERSLKYSDPDFQRYLQRGYPTLEALNAFWGITFPTWASVTREQARQGDGKALYGVGRASVDLANYQATVFHDVMEIWLDAIKAADSTRPVLTGRISLYRSLVSIPDGYSVVSVSMPPDVLESDLLSHNVQALDIARRGGKFRVLPALRVPANTSTAYTNESIRDWIQIAALHGSVGFGLEDWDLLAATYEIEHPRTSHWRRTMNAVSACRDLAFDFTPRPTAAVVYSPYASGLEVTKQPVYGYLSNYLPGEPSGLAAGLRLGSRYGVLDYVTVGDLLGHDLSQYGAILLPACLNLPQAQADQLDAYVQQGGAVMADLGLGMYQTGSWLQLPEPWMQGIGLVQMMNPIDRVGDLTFGETLPGLPSLRRGMRSTGVFRTQRSQTGPATDRNAYAVSGTVLEARLQENTLPLATISVRFDDSKQPVFSGLFGRQRGAGLALFATHPLWACWPLADPVSQALHGDLFARGAEYALMQDGLWGGQVQLAADDSRLCLLNLGTNRAMVRVWAYAARSHAYAGCISNFAASPTQLGVRPGTALLLANVSGNTLAAFSQTGLLVQPYQGEVTVQITQYEARACSFRIGGSGASARNNGTRGLELSGGQPVSVRLLLGTGTYPVAPNSRHTVTILGQKNDERTMVVTANGAGELDLSGIYKLETVTITPAG